MSPSLPHVFCCYRDTPARRAAITTGEVGGYLFTGIDAFAARGYQVSHNLQVATGRFAHHLARGISRWLEQRGGHSGDFGSALQNLRRMRSADLVWSSVDTLGIPVALLRQWGRLDSPMIYTSIGLPERLARLPEGGAKRRLIAAVAGCDRVCCYGWEEQRVLEAVLEREVVFLPFGVDTDAWPPLHRAKKVDVLSLGNDPMRDFPQLLRFAAARPQRRVRIITDAQGASTVVAPPANVEVRPPVPLEQVPEEMAAARVVALPVQENSYSGATTTLLQAMSMALPVVVSDVGAIGDGYGLRGSGGCALVPPGDAEAWSTTLEHLLSHPEERRCMGEAGQRHVVAGFTWKRLTNRLSELAGEVLTAAD